MNALVTLALCAAFAGEAPASGGLALDEEEAPLASETAPPSVTAQLVPVAIGATVASIAGLVTTGGILFVALSGASLPVVTPAQRVGAAAIGAVLVETQLVALSLGGALLVAAWIGDGPIRWVSLGATTVAGAMGGGFGLVLALAATSGYAMSACRGGDCVTGAEILLVPIAVVALPALGAMIAGGATSLALGAFDVE